MTEQQLDAMFESIAKEYHVPISGKFIRWPYETSVVVDFVRTALKCGKRLQGIRSGLLELMWAANLIGGYISHEIDMAANARRKKKKKAKKRNGKGK